MVVPSSEVVLAGTWLVVDSAGGVVVSAEAVVVDESAEGLQAATIKANKQARTVLRIGPRYTNVLSMVEVGVEVFARLQDRGDCPGTRADIVPIVDR